MFRSISSHILIASVVMLSLVAPTRAGLDSKGLRDLYEKITPSLVVVQYTYESELSRQDITSVGVVVSDDGRVMISEAVTPTAMPDSQMKDFKIIIPGDEETELEAEFMGRDDRSNMSFVKAKEARKWTPIKFEDVALQVGDAVYSIGLLPKDAGYKTYMMTSNVSALLRGPVPQVLVSGDGLGNIGSPVFNEQGKAVGIVHYQTGADRFLGTGGGGRGGRGGGGGSIASIMNPPKFFVPARDILISFSDPPRAEEPLKIPHLGVVQLTGLNKSELEYFDLKGKTAVQIGDVIPGFPAAKAGLKSRDIIVQMNGQPLERGDEPEEAAAIMTRKVQRMKPGDQVKFSIIRKKGDQPTEVAVNLEERPRQVNLAKRYFAEDLGFVTREMVFQDTYQLRIAPDSKGVIVDVIKPSGAAQTGKLEPGDVITKLNQTQVENLEQFKERYESFRKERARDAVVMEVLRGVNTEVVRIEPPQ